VDDDDDDDEAQKTPSIPERAGPVDWDARLVLSLPARRACCFGARLARGADGRESGRPSECKRNEKEAEEWDTRGKTGNGRARGVGFLTKRGGINVLDNVHCIYGISGIV